MLYSRRVVQPKRSSLGRIVPRHNARQKRVVAKMLAEPVETVEESDNPVDGALEQAEGEGVCRCARRAGISLESCLKSCLVLDCQSPGPARPHPHPNGDLVAGRAHRVKPLQRHHHHSHLRSHIQHAVPCCSSRLQGWCRANTAVRRHPGAHSGVHREL